MKKLLLPVLLFALVMTGSTFAQVNDDNILVIPKTAIAPTIDAVMDSIPWHYVGETLCIIRDGADAADPDDWFDLFGSVRLMWDDANLYMFLYVQDELINDNNGTGGDYNYDGVELYFDADDSKTEGAYDGVDDLQMRFNVGESAPDQMETGYGTSGSWGFLTAGIDYVIEQTDIGWNLECAIPLEDLQLVPDATFGFDVQVNDADESTRENMYRWWSNDNNEWQHANLFGTAILDSKRIIKADYLEVPKGAAPTVDGVKTAGEWADGVTISAARLQNDHDIGQHIEGWWDCRAQASLKWDDTNFYMLLAVMDEYYDYTTDEDTDWEEDSIELFFDGDNSKTNPYDGVDDIQIRFNLGQEGEGSIDTGYGTGANWEWDKTGTTYATLETADGWNVEVAIPLATMQIPVGQEFGFEMQLNDCDDPNVTPNRTEYRWWAPAEPTWSNASMFGTVVLVPAFAAVEENPTTIQTYELSQNYPNPFNPTTSISYSVAKTGNVELKVFDLLGKEVATLVNEVRPAGQYTATLSGSDLSSGVYFYTLNTGDQTFTKKMTLMK